MKFVLVWIMLLNGRPAIMQTQQPTDEPTCQLAAKAIVDAHVAMAAHCKPAGEET